MRWLTLNYDHTLLVNLLGNKEAEQILSDAYKVNIIEHIHNIISAILETSEALEIQ